MRLPALVLTIENLQGERALEQLDRLDLRLQVVRFIRHQGQERLFAARRQSPRLANQWSRSDFQSATSGEKNEHLVVEERRAVTARRRFYESGWVQS